MEGLEAAADAPHPTRRAVVKGSAAAAGLLVAGCSTYGARPQPANTGPVTLGQTSEIPVGGGKIFAKQLVVVTQPKDGEFKGFTAVCTHLGCTVASIRNGIIGCPCHGSEFSIVDGSVIQGPAATPLAAVPIAVNGTEVVKS
jgi:Rieske Fe-S protein